MSGNSQFVYYLQLAARSFKRNRVLTALMVVAIALGIGAAMTTLTVFYVLSGDPLPGQSQNLFHPRLEPRSMTGYVPNHEPSDSMTRFDAETLLREARADRQALMTAGNVAIEPRRDNLPAFRQNSRFTSADFFPMFKVPFKYGAAWTGKEDADRARVAVLGKTLNDRLFGGVDSVGKSVWVDNHELRVVGVIESWHPQPNFYDLTLQRGFGEPEDLFVPFSTSRDLRMNPQGNIDCWGDSSALPEGNRSLNAECAWVQYWVELGSAQKADAYRQYLVNYSAQQRAAGRFVRPTAPELDTLMGWLDYKRVVPADVRLQMWLAFGFLAVCLLNTVGLLLAKFLRRSGEIGVRRALGATRRQIFAQCLTEAGSVGLAGGLLGLLLAQLGLWAVRQQQTSYAGLAHLDPTMLAFTFVLAVAASVLAGLLPAWRACQVTPAIQLKSQ
ncbi:MULTISPECIES: ABC transporter permease [Lysobacter]|uniref:Efflux ABC transporter, permease protein n=2 Tax=Lysobacter TaxID=68 RepID=A0A0S2DCH2_LYSEN|nr:MULTISPECIES: ABC transporter permease [Lysobacter]ALN56056.1 efflux ABC transporter, permease protein [Lysobacter enzymogenes]QCW24988.1 FtsX-like permease family protein [Lysobacter enzymogenes]QQQ00548.1 ABC transporter permease [Lysobacter enzymogenes]UZW59990.1 ABC transporter permease [Lysobacter enzymogenes]WMT03829.1 FtsX-like permease family protein [Lysobacter yananisis]